MYKKKLTMACLAFAVSAAFVVASTASASPVLTDGTGGPPVVVGASITAKNTGPLKFTNSTVTVECSNAHLMGSVTGNSGSSIKAEIPKGGATLTGTGGSGDCTSNLLAIPVSVTVNSKLCLETRSGTDTMFTTGCGNVVSLTLNFTGYGPCNYRAASVNGIFVTNAHARLNIVEREVELVEGVWICPSAGKLDIDFDFYTTNGVELAIS
jgi:hypothetical protein